MKKITIEFETDELKEEFEGWMSDGGGEQSFNMVEDLADFKYEKDKIILTKPNR